MKTRFDDLPGWGFDIVESTPGGYTVTGRGPYGLEVQFQGADPDRLLERAKTAAIEVEGAAAANRRRPPGRS